MRRITLAVPGRIDTRTGGYIYDRRMAEGLAQRGWSVDVRELDGSFPFPTAAALEGAAAVFAGVPDEDVVVVDGLALSVMPDLVQREAARLHIVALVHLPLAADVCIDTATATRFAVLERRAFGAAALVVATGRATLPLLARYEVPRDRLVVVEPGTDPAPLAHGSGDATLRLLSVATIGPGKGHERLVRALADLQRSDWRLTCAGNLARHPATVERLRAALLDLGLQDRVTLVGDLDALELAACYDSSDLFVLATLQETYGMAVAEALARGLPVVSTATGAIPDLVGTDAGIVVPPGNTEALTAALSRVVGDASLRARFAEGARRVRGGLRTWNEAVEEMSDALARLESHG